MRHALTAPRPPRPPRAATAPLLTLVALALAVGGAGCGAQDASDAALSAPTGAGQASDARAPSYSELSGGAGGGVDAPDAVPLDDPEGEDPAAQEVAVNPEVEAGDDNLITFAVDVDTASYSIARRYIQSGALPPPQSVRVEEFVNYFDYRQAPPAEQAAGPFGVELEAAPSPFGEGKRLLRVGVKGFEVPLDRRPAANLVFLLDVSGSMQADDKLGLVKRSMGLLLDNLKPTDTLSIVTYAGADRVVLRPTEVTARDRILNAINALDASGGTNGAAGIRTAYDLAQEAFITGGINRVVLCTDGDFNLGVTGEELYRLIEERREEGVTVSVLGFGMRDFNDGQMEQIADRGNGNYAFIDSIEEARRALVYNLTSTLFTIAKDVKLQLEVNPFAVRAHRLLGYENRAIADDDFRDDRVDAGEIGAGHTVTALVELSLYGEGEGPAADALALPELDAAFTDARGPLAVLRVRSKTPDPAAADGFTAAATEQRFELPADAAHARLEDASPRLRFAAAAAEFAEILRLSPFAEGDAREGLEAVAALASGAVIEDDEAMRELVTLARAATELIARSAP
ncbi:MAG: VWA domain-containing protein [Deltaproteobacteria bacterium]|nr:VWA domain-containing protein [Deltaproteobacteria bacterium]